MRGTWRWIVLMLGLLAAPASGEVKIERKPADVKRKTFDPAHRPANMPPMKGQEAAVTQSQFECGVSLTYEVLDRRQVDGKSQVTLKLRSIRVLLRLGIEIWLPTNAPAKLARHEEGHRRITQRFYDDAETTAKAIAKSFEGKSFTATASTPEAAERQATKAAANEFCQTYLTQTAQPALHVGDIYDTLTAHGTKDEPSEDEAIRQAFEKAGHENTPP